MWQAEIPTHRRPSDQRAMSRPFPRHDPVHWPVARGSQSCPSFRRSVQGSFSASRLLSLSLSPIINEELAPCQPVRAAQQIDYSSDYMLQSVRTAPIDQSFNVEKWAEITMTDHANKPDYLPTPLEIARQCEEIQSRWSNRERRRRMSFDLTESVSASKLR